MKGSWTMAALILAGCFAAGAGLAQHDIEHMGHEGMKMQQAQGVKLEVQDDTARHLLTVRLGPLDLPAHTSHHAAAQAPDQFLTIPFDG